MYKVSFANTPLLALTNLGFVLKYIHIRALKLKRNESIENLSMQSSSDIVVLYTLRGKQVVAEATLHRHVVR